MQITCPMPAGSKIDNNKHSAKSPSISINIYQVVSFAFALARGEGVAGAEGMVQHESAPTPPPIVSSSQARRDQVCRAGAEAGARGTSGPAHAPEVVRGKPDGQAGRYRTADQYVHTMGFVILIFFSCFRVMYICSCFFFGLLAFDWLIDQVAL